MKKRLIVPMVLSSSLLVGSFTTADVLNVQAESKITQETHWNEKAKANVPLFVKEKHAVKRSQSTASDALNYLANNGNKYGLKKAKNNLKAKKVNKDSLGMTHVRFEQTEHGVPVEGTEIIVHYNANNEIVTVNGYHNTDLAESDIATTPSLPSNDATSIAKSSVDAPNHLTQDPSSELVIYPSEGENNLAYKVNVNFLGDQPGNWFVFVDAHTGDVINKYNTIMHSEKTQKGIGTGVLGDQRDLHITKNKEAESGSQFQLADFSHPNLDGIVTYDYGTEGISVFTGDDASFKDDYDRAAVDAHFNSEKVYKYFKDEHDRNSLDNEGMPIQSVVHYGENYNNAFWNGTYMVYGDGDGKFMNTLSAGLDVAAHEMTHGVTSNSANLKYQYQSGALNEAFSDIFAALVDDDDWEVGEDIMASDAKADGRSSLRSLSDPSKYPVGEEYVDFGDGEGMYPSHMDEFYDLPLELDNGGVHINSSIINHAAYLTAQEIGREALGQIYYRALTVYLTEESTFSDARDAIITSATDIYGEDSKEVAGAISGLDQVGIYE